MARGLSSRFGKTSGESGTAALGTVIAAPVAMLCMFGAILTAQIGLNSSEVQSWVTRSVLGAVDTEMPPALAGALTTKPDTSDEVILALGLTRVLENNSKLAADALGYANNGYGMARLARDRCRMGDNGEYTWTACGVDFANNNPVDPVATSPSGASTTMPFSGTITWNLFVWRPLKVFSVVNFNPTSRIDENGAALCGCHII